MLQHAPIAAGQWDERLKDASHGNGDFPVVRLWYSTLIGLTPEEPRKRLLEGCGDLELPAGAYFTGCQLTPAGKAAAEKVLALHPDWRELLAEER